MARGTERNSRGNKPQYISFLNFPLLPNPTRPPMHFCSPPPSCLVRVAQAPHALLHLSPSYLVRVAQAPHALLHLSPSCLVRVAQAPMRCCTSPHPTWSVSPMRCSTTLAK